MAENHRRALDKVILRAEAPVEDRAASWTFTAPGTPGDYVVKVFAADERTAAAGHVRIRVARRGKGR